MAWRAALRAALVLVCQEGPGERLDHLDEPKPLIVHSPLDVNGCLVCVRMSHRLHVVTSSSLSYHQKTENIRTEIVTEKSPLLLYGHKYKLTWIFLYTVAKSKWAYSVGLFGGLVVSTFT